jgi:hypothetical protein
VKKQQHASRALVVGAVVGFVFAVFPSCGTKPVTVCSVSNCDGCCDDQGVCQVGDKLEQCGASGISCVPCTGTGVTCQRVSASNPFGGACKTGGADGGAGGGTGGGSATGGGGTGGGPVDAGVCNATNCPTGCCSTSNTCITVTTPQRCGTGGAACTTCNKGNTCVAGACAACAGCVDVNVGDCKAGTANTQCGKAGEYCLGCDMNAGQTCQGGTCFGGTTCNSGTCLGCCDGNTCITPAQYSTSQCGQGSPGAACRGCIGGATCDAVDAGACVGGSSGTGGGGGLPGFDGGLPFCDSQNPCGAGQCCDVIAGGVGTSCKNLGETCAFGGPACIVSALFGKPCTCKNSGICE